MNLSIACALLLVVHEIRELPNWKLVYYVTHVSRVDKVV